MLDLAGGAEKSLPQPILFSREIPPIHKPYPYTTRYFHPENDPTYIRRLYRLRIDILEVPLLLKVIYSEQNFFLGGQKIRLGLMAPFLVAPPGRRPENGSNHGSQREIDGCRWPPGRSGPAG